MDRSAEFERWIERAIADEVGVGCAYLHARNRHLAEDVLQEAYLRAVKCKDKFDSEEHLRNWLCVVVINLVRAHRRSKKNHMQPLHEPEALPDNRPHLLDAEDREHLMHYLDQLLPHDRLLIEYHCVQDLKLREIHELHPDWGSIATLSKRVRSVFEQLRAWLTQGEAVVS